MRQTGIDIRMWIWRILPKSLIWTRMWNRCVLNIDITEGRSLHILNWGMMRVFNKISKSKSIAVYAWSRTNGGPYQQFGSLQFLILLLQLACFVLFRREWFEHRSSSMHSFAYFVQINSCPYIMRPPDLWRVSFRCFEYVLDCFMHSETLVVSFAWGWNPGNM